MQCVYILDDNQDFGQTLTKMVRSLGFDCVAFTMCEDFIEAVREQPPSLYMVDMWLGTTTALKIQKKHGDLLSVIPGILMSGGGGGSSLETVTAKAEIEGFRDVLYKPFSRDELKAALECVFQDQRS